VVSPLPALIPAVADLHLEVDAGSAEESIQGAVNQWIRVEQVHSLRLDGSSLLAGDLNPQQLSLMLPRLPLEKAGKTMLPLVREAPRDC